MAESNITENSENTPVNDNNSNSKPLYRIYFCNIPYTYSSKDLRDLFTTKIGNVENFTMYLGEDNRSRGSGTVSFSNYESMENCFKLMRGYDIKGRKLVLHEDTKERDKYGNVVKDRKSIKYNESTNKKNKEKTPIKELKPATSNAKPEFEVYMNNTYGVNAEVLKSLKIELPLCSRIFIANVDFRVTEKKLREIFSLCGKIVSIDLYIDSKGASRGIATIDYLHPFEAVQAISMLNNQPLYDRILSVRLDHCYERTVLPEGLKSLGKGLGKNGAVVTEIPFNFGYKYNNNEITTDNTEASTYISQPTEETHSMPKNSFLAKLEECNRSLNQSASNSTAPNNVIAVTNVPATVSKSALYRKFSNFGKVQRVLMTGTTGYITFSNISQAKHAIDSLDGVTVDGKVIEVFFSK